MIDQRRKLDQENHALFKEEFSSDHPDLAHTPSCEKMHKDIPECEKTLLKLRTDIEALQHQFKEHFQDLYTMKPLIPPLSAAVSEQPPESLLELCVLQSNPFLSFKKTQRDENFNFTDYDRSPALHCSRVFRSSQHSRECSYLGEQLLSNEAHQVERKKQAADKMKLCSSSCRSDPQTLTFILLYTSRRDHKCLYADPPASQ